MVRTLHAAGIEVILDVVYNHTCEGNHMGPTLSWRGIDNKSYYRLSPEDPRFYMDFTGCGNTLNMMHPRVLQLIMDSLRYWVLEMHVDGFRFDLASTLARELHEVNRLGAFFDIIHQDPVISQVKLIAEPWDVGPGGYQVGNFPIGWAEWNGKYRDTVRSYWRGDAGRIAERDRMSSLRRRLRTETFIFNLKDALETAPMVPGYDIERIDDHTLEIETSKEQNLNDIFTALSALGIEVLSMRNKVNRLEEIFMRLVNRT